MLFVGYALRHGGHFMKHRAKRKKHKPKGHNRKSSGKHHRKPPPYHSRAPPLFCANSTKFTEKGEIMKLFFESYNGLVTLGATMNFGRRCNGCDG